MRFPTYFFTGICVLFLSFVSCKQQNPPKKQTSANAESMFNEEIRNHYFVTLDSAAYYMQKLDTSASLAHNRACFLKSREWYKRAEPMMIAYDYQNYLSMNAPNLLKIEIDDYTDIKKLSPRSFQVLEELLFAEVEVPMQELQLVLDYLQVRIPYIRRNHIIYTQRDRHHLKMIRDAIVNVATKGITGFDSPMLSNSLNEAIYNYETIAKVISIYQEAFKSPDLYHQWTMEIEATINSLKASTFDDFDRYGFIKNHTNKQLELVNQTATDWGIALNTSRSLNSTANNLFSRDFFNMDQFTIQGSPAITDERIALGKKLFNDPSLSSTGAMSCATCHLESKAFTDGHKKGLGIDGIELQRNTPTLTYAVYQRSLFYDGRADGLEDQIVNVVNNENEFHLDLNTVEQRIKEDDVYASSFDELYDGEVTNQNVRHAIATYIRSLAPFDSRFDKNMQGSENTLTSEEKLGFNLFMGKAACATCHFPPAFNGTVPPKYMETEFENLGVPKNADFDHPILDDDPGQFHPYEVEEKRNFFKTSTVRNVALTGPYMHNGVYESLEEVVQFYNVGGGQGMGLEVPYQTLPPDSLHLTDKEQKALVAFMQSLTDARFLNEK
ncbi:cytochrome-c peroxidase [Allomuricauda sp. ARW1Y1]|uniref:cytochrome-c peroxidase n=1 Tax=Allomuricauda sp. ARW1Y1 TaxID=2663843 RepID=UPI0015C6D3D3|nr:cytochrome c peroxidase [Muricauda sp. ARW1Y1]NYJ28840.1 cytochrome c peroxidase [Muricauda sp. ARW1Y1]